MALFGIVFFLVALVLIGAGFAIGLVACVAAVALVGLGVLSSSVFVGVSAKRPSAGVRAFLLQVGILAGIPAGIATAWLASSFVAAIGGHWPVLVYGAAGGAFAGCLIAVTLDFIFRRAHAFGSARLTVVRSRLTAVPK